MTPAADAITLGTHTAGNYVAAGAVAGNGLSGSAGAEGATFTVTSNATTAATANTIAYRGGSGELNSVGLNAGSGNILTTGYVGRDSNDYIAWSNNSHAAHVINGTTRLRVDTAGIDVTGAIIATGDVTAYSDQRLKENIAEIENAMEKVNGIRGVTFDMHDKDGNHTGKSMGVIAQEVQAMMPEAIYEDEDGFLAVKYGNLVGLAMNAIKELNTGLGDAHKEIAENHRKIDEMKAQMAEMNSMISELMEKMHSHD